MAHFVDAELDRLLSELDDKDLDLEALDPTFSSSLNASARNERAHILEQSSTSCTRDVTYT